MSIAITEDHQLLAQTAAEMLAKRDARGATRAPTQTLERGGDPIGSPPRSVCPGVLRTPVRAAPGRCPGPRVPRPAATAPGRRAAGWRR